MNKKANTDVMMFLIIFELLMIVVSGITVFKVISAAKDPSEYWAKYYARDIGTLITTLAAYEGNGAVVYDNIKPELKLTFMTRNNTLIINKEYKNNKKIEKKYDINIKSIESIIEKPTTITIIKKQNGISITG